MATTAARLRCNPEGVASLRAWREIKQKGSKRRGREGGGGQQPLRSFIITHERAHTHKKKARGFFIGRFAAALRLPLGVRPLG